MSHLLSTVNPEAAAAITERPIQTAAPAEDLLSAQPVASAAPPVAPEPEQTSLPGVGDGVTYFPRPGELRAGKGLHAAIVTAVNPEDRTVDLVVVYDADDFVGMRRVPARLNREGMGWEPKPAVNDARIAALEAAVDRLSRQVLGSLVLSDGDSLLGILDEHEDRLTELEPQVTPVVRAAAPVAAKAKPKAKRKKAKQNAAGAASARPSTTPATD